MELADRKWDEPPVLWALLGGRSTALAAGIADDTVAQDVRILNTAIAAEHEAVATRSPAIAAMRSCGVCWGTCADPV